MCDIRQQLLDAVNEGSFLDTISQLYPENKTDIGKVLADLHNQGHLDAMSEFMALNQKAYGHKFFTIRHILEDALSKLNAPILDVMLCVKHLTEQAGQDMTAGMLFPPFIDYCQADCDRPNAVLSLAVDQHEKWKDFISPTLIAGARIDLSDYVTKAIKLTTNQNIEISSRAVFALGRIDYSGDTLSVTKVLEALQLIVQGEYNDQLFASVLRASYPLLHVDKTKEQAISDLIAVTLKKRGKITLHSASELFLFEKKTLPDSIVDYLLKAFEDVDVQHTGTLGNIDYGLVDLLEKDQGEKAVKLLEILLIKHRSDFSISKFDIFTRKIVQNHGDLLSQIVTHWFLSEAVTLGRSALELVKKFDGEHLTIVADMSQLQDGINDIHLLLARKACGWFFQLPVSAVAFMISLIDTASSDEIEAISAVLFDPLLMSYPGSVKDYLQNLPDKSSDKVKAVVGQLLTDLDSYHKGLDLVKDIKELIPSITQRETYNRQMNREMNLSYKETQKDSLMGQIFGKPSVLLYGNSSIYYVHHGLDGEKSRQEVQMHSISTSIEFPSVEYLDPHSLNMKLQSFRLEGCCS